MTRHNVISDHTLFSRHAQAGGSDRASETRMGLGPAARVGTALRTPQSEIAQVVVIHVGENVPVAGALAAGADKGSKG
jgi:uncharacterized Zn-binding protein involved in type VI secretion